MRYGLIVLVLGAVAACTSDADPGPTDPPSPPSTTAVPTTPTPASTPPASPSPSIATTGPNVRPGEKPPVLPALAKTNSRPGAVVFASYWFKALDWGYATTDSTLAKSLYLPQCTACDKFMKNFDDTKASNQHFRGGRLSLGQRRLVSRPTKYPNAVTVDVVFSVDALQTLAADERLIGTDPAQEGLRYRVYVQWIGARWAVRDYDRVVTK